MDSPLVTATLQACALSALSNILGQLAACWQSDATYSINPTELTHFVLFTLLSCPPNILWQNWLEAQFPGYTKSLTTLEKEKVLNNAVTGSSSTGTEKNDSLRSRVDQKTMTEASTPPTPEKKAQLSIRNTAIKFSLDQTFGAGINTVLFIAGIALLRGHSMDSIIADVQNKFWPMIFAGQKLWPAVSVLSFTVIPVERRVLFGSIVGLFWGAYLSVVSGGGK